MKRIATATPTKGPPPLMRSMIFGMMSQPITVTAMISAEAISAPRVSPLTRVKAKTRRPGKW